MMLHKIRGRRAELDLSQRDVAVALGISESSYRAKESGKVKFSESEKFALGRILVMTPGEINDWLFGGQFPLETAKVAIF